MSTTSPSRRTVAKGIAWSVPVVAVTAASPAYAASGRKPSLKPGKAYKWPGASCAGSPNVPSTVTGNKAYLFTFQVTNNDPTKKIYLYCVTLTTTSAITFEVIGTDPALGTAILPGETTSFNVWANSDSSGNLRFNAQVDVEWGHDPIPVGWACGDASPDPDNHTDITVKWAVTGTPTTTSQGFAQCVVPPFSAVTVTQ